MALAHAPLRLAIIGCGAICERGHLPAAAAVPGVRVTLLVDSDLPRAQALARRFGVAAAAGDCATVPTVAQAAIIATPPALHADIACDLLSRGVHVLVEKPMATTPEDCDRMIAAGQASGAVLAVAMVRRFQRANRLVKTMIQAGMLGAIESASIDDCGVFDWPIASGAMLDRRLAGGGVLMDVGVHALDTLLWWLGPPSDFQYGDDNQGGVEADCRLELTMASGATAVVRLSRLRDLPKRVCVHGKLGSVEMPLYDARLNLRLNGAPDLSVVGEIRGDSGQPDNPMAAQLSDFAASIRQGRQPLVSGADARQAIALIHACYSRRQASASPWMQPITVEVE